MNGVKVIRKTNRSQPAGEGVISIVKRFSKKLLIQIEDLKMKHYSISQIAKKLKITPTDVKNGLSKIYEDELKQENA